MRELLRPLVAMVAILGAVYLLNRLWPGPHSGQLPDKVQVVHSPLFQLSLPDELLSAEGEAKLFPHDAEDAQLLTAEEALRKRHHPPLASGEWTSEYDGYFRKYTKRYFGVGFDWRWFKSQSIVESALNPKAGNKGSGAVGLMQILPSTFGDISERRPEIGSLYEPRWNIAAGIAYMDYLYEKDAIKALRPPARLAMSFASYNRGYSGMLRVMAKKPPNKTGWQRTLTLAPRQTRHYVYRIIAVKSGNY